MGEKLMEAKRAAMEGFIKYDSCEKIQRALSSNVRRTLIEDLQVGDEVYYKRKNSDGWHGPAKVILIEGQVITMKHGNVTVKVSTVSLVKVPHICTIECETKNSTNRRENSGSLEGEQDRKEIKYTEEKQERNSTRCKKRKQATKRNLESTDTSDKR